MSLMYLFRKTKNPLADKQPIYKFLGIKSVILLANVQSFIISLIFGFGIPAPWECCTSEESSAALQNMCSILEMVLLIPLYYKAYPVISEEFEGISGLEILLSG